MSIETIMDTFTIAAIFAVLGFGVFLSFKILNITDLTVEASFGFGAAISGMMCRKDMVTAFGGAADLLPYLSLLCAFIGGAVAGLITAILHTKLKINSVLSGILTLTAFYTFNLLVIKNGTYASIGLSGSKGVTLFPSNMYLKTLIMVAFAGIVGVLLALFFKTRLGLSIRACGDNEQMTKTQCISTDLMKIIGLMLSNALVALAGAFFVQNQASYSTNIEKGMMVVGVATIIIGEIVILGKHNINLMFVGIFVGSVVYRFIYALALRIDFISTSYLHFITAGLIVLIMFVSKAVSDYKAKKNMYKSADALDSKPMEVDHD